jgi:hypothetical protein
MEQHRHSDQQSMEQQYDQAGVGSINAYAFCPSGSATHTPSSSFIFSASTLSAGPTGPFHDDDEEDTDVECNDSNVDNDNTTKTSKKSVDEHSKSCFF